MYEKHFLIDFILNLPKKGQVFDNQSLADMLSAIGKMNPSLFVNIVHSIATYDKEVERVKKIYNSNDYEYEIKNRKINSLELFRPYSFCSYFSDIFETLFEHYGQRLPDEIMALFTDFDTSYFVSSDLKKDFKEKLIQSILKPQTISYTQAIEKHIDKLLETQHYLNTVIEDMESFQIRKVRWAIHVLLEKEGCVKTWKVKEMTGLKGDISEMVQIEINS